MNKERILKWIEAAESGVYMQTRGRLRSHENCYCILGVGVDVCIREIEVDETINTCEVKPEWKHPTRFSDYEVMGLTGSMPICIGKWYGFETVADDDIDGPVLMVPPLIYNGHKQPLYRLNDYTCALSLREIAQLMREQWIEGEIPS